MKSMRYILVLSALALPIMGNSWPFNENSLSITNAAVGSSAWMQEKISSIHYQASNLDTNVLRLSLTAYAKARAQGLDNKRLLTIINYALPSSDARLWVIDVLHGKVLFNTWVTHGKNSGGVHATSFSNDVGSRASTLGVLLTDSQPYVGHNGYSLRLHGLEPGINDNAYRRSVVFHGASYASEAVAKSRGALGLSWGCPAVGPAVAKPLINTIKDKTLVVAYYPDRKWLNTSKWVG